MGAGSEYLAVTADGNLYPCHQFAGMEDFYMGNVHDADVDQESKDVYGYPCFHQKGCSECWAKYYCSGGCAANAYHSTGISGSHMKLAARRKKKRIETAIAIKVFEEDLL